MSTMEELLSAQEQIASAIEQLYSNFKKDGSDRKTPDYIKRRLDTLDSYWNEYEQNHNKLCGLGNKSYPYFTTNQYESSGERYTYIRTAIQSSGAREGTPSSLIKPAIFRPGTPMQESSYQARGSDSKTDEMLRKQSSNFKAFEHTLSNIDLDSISEKWEFDHLLRTIQSRWSTIDTLHWELDSESTSQKSPEYESHFFQAERKFNEIIKAINRKFSSVSHRENTTPKIEIPTFSGNYHQWSSFKDLFTETIHANPTLSPAQKMQFLKTKVKGEAERLIQHLSISADNYQITWDLLNNRYNNKRLILSSLFDLMLNMPAAQQSSLNHIKKIHDVTRESLNAIRNLGINVESWDPLIIHLMCQKLDTETLSEYLSSVREPKEVPNLEEFLLFLEKTFTTMESSRRKSDSKPAQQNHKNQKSFHNCNTKPSSTGRIEQSVNGKNVYAAKYYRCAICKKNNHSIFICNKFREMTPSAKFRTAENLKLCKNCLYCHNGNECVSEKRCRECKLAHNTLLHDAFSLNSNEDGASTSSSANVSEPKQGQKPTARSSHVSQTEIPEILLATAVVKVEASNGSFIEMRALLDQGSQTSLISENAAQQLGLPRQKCQGVITGIGAKQSNCKGAINIKCVSANNNFEFHTDAPIMKNLIKNLPSFSFAKPTWSYLDHITLADPEFNHSRPVDILFGADIYSLILLEGICRGEQNNSPIAQNTRLGWILSGSARTLQCNVIINDLEEIQRFWEIEDIAEESNLSLEDQECVDYYKTTTTRRDDGRYEVRLPMKTDFETNLGFSKNKAIAQFKSLERKFIKNHEMENHYKSFMKEYLSMGHMAPAISSTKPDFYFTHHGVERAESTTTKFRVVFNGSAKTSSGYSLNDVMKRGPNLQQDLQSLIIKWRQFKFAFTADIEMMFRQIWINNEDQKLQKLIYRNSELENIKEWELLTVTYGTKAAPFLAMMTLRQLASDAQSQQQYSAAAAVLESSFYMDDLVHGAHQLENAKQLREDLINLLITAGFNLRKWKSNVAELSDANMHNTQDSFDFKQPESSKTLGLSWNNQQDMFMFKSKIEPTAEKETKRSLLSDISKLFDPLGWLAPISTKFKIIFQKVWLSAIKWDEPLPEEILCEWITIKNDIININKIQVPRWLSTKENDAIELHGFCDASTKAYACVIYCKIKRGDQPIITLLVAKTRVVPCGKNISLPRLELMAGHLLSKLVRKVQQCLSTYQLEIYGWSDSMIVLGWLSGDPTRWKTFVANRVTDIKKTMPSTCWRYVKSEENPADCASRGLTASQLIKHDLWWQGPSWLSDFDGQGKQPAFTTDLEMKKVRQVNAVTEPDLESNIVYQLLSKHSSITKVMRILSWMFRIKERKINTEKYLSLSELHKAEILLIKQVQQIEFSSEIKNITENCKVHSKSKILQLNPFLDENGILRVGGRLRNSNLPTDMKHPIIVPGNSRLAELLIDRAHKASFHGGARLTSAFLRNNYWLVGGNKIVKKQLRGCVKCRRHDPIKHEQIMGDYPAARTRPARPFQHTGVDYTGFVDIKSSKGRGIKSTKGYIAVFVCMVTKAVHLELVSDLSSSAFLAALRRMAAQRGAPSHIYSDNGTNFVGANKVLNREYLDLQATLDPSFYSAITDMKIQWHFNAPGWPSAGGLWEAAVKSLKYHLKRVIGEQKLTYEEYSTLLSQLEACLNARPLCPLTEDPEDMEYLTPAHFLASGPTLTIIETERDLRTRWHLTQKIFEDVWKKWQSEYLSQLSTRSKWRQPQENLKINDVVIIHDANLPSGKWALGRITALHPGKDDYVRVVTLKTKNGELKRPISKISRLPIHGTDTVQQDCKFQQKQDRVCSATVTNRTKKSYLSHYIFMLFMLFFAMMATPVHGKYQVTNLNSSQGFYFDHISNIRLERDQWNLVIYYDMDPYWQSHDLLIKYINHLDGICNDQTNKKIAQCDIVLLQLHHGLNELAHYNHILLGKQLPRSARSRVPRGLVNGVGFLANKLFGVLDQDFAEQYERDIETIRDNEKHLAVLWKNQTSIVEGEFNLLKRVESSIDKQSKIFNQHLNNLEKTFNKQRDDLQVVSSSCDFTLSSAIAQGILVSLRNIQETVIDALTNVYVGRFNFHLVTPEQLRDEMNTITGMLTKDVSLPWNLQSDIAKMYHLLSVRARASNKFIIFEIKIPLVGRDNFELYKLIPIPQQFGRKMTSLVPISEYVAINMQKDSYVPLAERDVHSCIELDKDSHLCPLHQPIYQMKLDENLCVKSLSDQCQSSSSPCMSTWTGLNNINTYLYSCCGQCSVRIICDHQITADQLHRSGIISIDEGCIIKSEAITIFAHKTLANTIREEADVLKIEIPPINSIFNISTPLFSVLNQTDYSNHQEYFEKIDRQLKQLKASAAEGVLADRVSYHDVHHYVAIYLVLFAVVVGVAVLLWRRWRARAQPGAPAAAPPALASPPAPQRAEGAPIELRATRFELPTKCVSESAVHECCVRSEPVLEKSFSARVISDKSSSPVFFDQKFNRTA